MIMVPEHEALELFLNSYNTRTSLGQPDDRNAAGGRCTQANQNTLHSQM